MLHPRRASGLVLSITALLLTGCTSTSSPSTATSTTETTSPVAAETSSATATITINRSIDVTLDVADATPAQYTGSPVTMRPKAEADDMVTLLTERADNGKFLALEDSTAPLEGAGATLGSSMKVGLWSQSDGFVEVAETGKETDGVLAGAERQVMSIAQAGDRLVWLETPTTDLSFMEWSLRTARTDGSDLRELAHSQTLDGAARPLPTTGGMYPVVIGDWVYWAASVATTSAPDPQDEADWEFNILRTKISTSSTVETVAKNAVMPAAIGDDLIYAARESMSSNNYEIHRMAVSGDGTDEILVEGARSGSSDIIDLAASEDFLTWGVRSAEVGDEGWTKSDAPGQIFVLDLNTDQITTIITADEVGGYGHLALTRTGVLWGNGSGNGDPTEYYLNMTTKKLFSLAKYRGNSSVMADPDDDTVLWTKGTDATTHRSIWHMAELDTTS